MKRTIIIKSRDVHTKQLVDILNLYNFSNYFTHIEIKACYYGIDIPILKRYLVFFKMPLENGGWDNLVLEINVGASSKEIKSIKLIKRKVSKSYYRYSPFWFPWLFRRLRFDFIEYSISDTENKYFTLHFKRRLFKPMSNIVVTTGET